MPAPSFDATLLAIQNAADAGAFGFGKQTRPTEAQRMAGNYAKGRVTWQGLPLVIEQPRGTYREGKDWRTLMASHYGYIAGTRGNDGDEVDCFIGSFVDSTRVYVVNQVLRGRFDEHKVMLAYDSEESARDAYMRSYSRGWTGLDSIAALSLSQFKWWLKNGDLTKPLSADNLPYEGTEPMKRVYWTTDAEPMGQSLDTLLYGIRQHDGAAGLLLDSVSVADIHSDPENESVLSMDAMVTPFNKLQPKMNVLRAVMERSGGEVKPVAVQVSEPFKQRGTVNVAAVFELSDGQTVTVYFHNPDSTPSKLAPGDELISWKWLLNKKDVTIVVAPERGSDLNIREVARRLMRLAEKNSPAFQRANAKRSERMGAIQSLTDEVAGLEATLASEQTRLEVVKLQAEEIGKASASLPQGWGIRLDVATGKYRATYLGDDYSAPEQTGDFDTPAEAAAAAMRWSDAIAAAKAQAEAEEAAKASAQPTFAVGDYLKANFPSLNKRQSIADYKEKPSGSEWLCKVQKVLSLTPEAYDEFANNLMASNPELGDGGSASDSPLITNDLFKRSLSDWTPEQQAEWKATNYSLVTVVEAPVRETFVVDAQGYDYARYVGLNPAPAAAPVVKAAPVKAADPIEVDDHKALAEFTRVRITSVGNENLYFSDPNGVEYYTKLVEPDDYKVDQWVSMADDRAVKEAIASQSPAPAEDGSVTVDGFTYTVDTSDGYMVTFTAPETVRGLKLWAREEDAINAKIQEAIEMVKNSPHLEKRWNSKYGEVTHVALADMPTLGEGSELYYVVYNNGAFVKKVRASEFDEVMRQEAYEATPEGAAAIEADRAKRAEESAAIAAQREAAEKAAKDRNESLEAMVNEWLNTTSYTSVQKGSSRSILLREAIYPEFDSAVLARVEFVQRVVEGGAKTDVRQINRIKDKSRAQFNRMDNREQQEHERKVREGGTVSEYWLGNYTITKTEYDYANYLIGAKAAEPSPAKESTVTDNPDAATLRAIIDGTTDPLTANLEALEAIYERNADNAEIQALFEQAVNVVIEAESKATASV